MLIIKNNMVRNLLRYTIPLFLIPVTVLIGFVLVEEKQHLFISLAVAILAVLLFFAGFEKKPQGNWRLIITAVMIALSVAGRFIPFLKPITALTVISAVYLGSEVGFTVGALSALLSNFYFGQGPWTPFQMLAWGLIGLIAGWGARLLSDNRAALLTYGALSGVLYSLVMDVWTVLWYNGILRPDLYFAAVVISLPHTVLYAISNLIFLLLLAKPFGEKLQRIKIKYDV